MADRFHHTVLKVPPPEEQTVVADSRLRELRRRTELIRKRAQRETSQSWSNGLGIAIPTAIGGVDRAWGAVFPIVFEGFLFIVAAAAFSIGLSGLVQSRRQSADILRESDEIIAILDQISQSADRKADVRYLN